MRKDLSKIKKFKIETIFPLDPRRIKSSPILKQLVEERKSINSCAGKFFHLYEIPVHILQKLVYKVTTYLFGEYRN